MEATRSSQTPVLARAKGRHIPEDAIVHKIQYNESLLLAIILPHILPHSFEINFNIILKKLMEN
jgi:hypothetical protein